MSLLTDNILGCLRSRLIAPSPFSTPEKGSRVPPRCRVHLSGGRCWLRDPSRPTAAAPRAGARSHGDALPPPDRQRLRVDLASEASSSRRCAPAIPDCSHPVPAARPRAPSVRSLPPATSTPPQREPTREQNSHSCAPALMLLQVMLAGGATSGCPWLLSSDLWVQTPGHDLPAHSLDCRVGPPRVSPLPPLPGCPASELPPLSRPGPAVSSPHPSGTALGGGDGTPREGGRSEGRCQRKADSCEAGASPREGMWTRSVCAEATGRAPAPLTPESRPDASDNKILTYKTIKS